MIKKTLKPRYVVNKKPNRLSDIRIVEKKAIEAVHKNNIEEAAAILFEEISRPASNGRQLSRTRLFDLLVILCMKNAGIHGRYFQKTVETAGLSRVAQLKDRSKLWPRLTPENIRRIKNRTLWDKIQLTMST